MPELPLRDIHLPDPISWWPLAIGWWLLLGLGILLTFAVYFFIKRFFQPTLKKHALRALDSIEHTYRSTQDGIECVIALSALLRRIVLSQQHLTPPAGIIGRPWLELLDKSLKTPEFSQGVGQILLTGPYQPEIDNEDLKQLLKLCRKWVNRL